MTETAPDFAGIKSKQQQTWATGDYAVIGRSIHIVAEILCETADLRGGERVLDVAAGSGNGAIAAARRWAEVTATDYVPPLLERARLRAEAEGMPITIREADAEALPFADGSFDLVMSLFGAMFAPDQERTARELLRVCRPGGRVAMANWTPDGLIGEMFRTVARHAAPPPGLRPPSQWGTLERLRELFPADAAEVWAEPRDVMFRFRSAEHWLDLFRRYFGPMVRAFAALDEAGGKALESDLLALMERHNRADDGTLVAPGRYLEVVVRKR